MANERQERAARAEQMRKEREKADRKQRNLISVAIVVVVVALIAVGGYAVKSASDDRKDNTDLVAPNHVNDDYGFVYDAAAAGGTAPAGADPVKVILTEDFQCPACLSFEQQSGAFLADLVKKGEITIEYRPISFLDNASGNNYSSNALNAALCVLDKGGVAKYKVMHDLLYANQPAENTVGPDEKALIATAETAGVSGIDSCVNTKRFGPWIEDAYDNLTDDGFKGTPWVRIDGKDIEAPTPAALQQAIDAAKKA